MKKLRQEKVKLFVLVKSSSRWEFCKTKGDAINSSLDYQMLILMVWGSGCTFAVTQTVLSKHPDISAKDLCQGKNLDWSPRGLPIFLADFQLFHLKVYQERRVIITEKGQLWVAKNGFSVGVSQMSSTFFTVDFPLWWSSVSNNSVNNEYLHMRICKGLLNVLLQVITCTLGGRRLGRTVLYSKVSKTSLEALSNFLLITQPWAESTTFLGSKPLVLTAMFCYCLFAFTDQLLKVWGSSWKLQAQASIFSSHKASHIPFTSTCSGSLWFKDPVVTCDNFAPIRGKSQKVRDEQDDPAKFLQSRNSVIIWKAFHTVQCLNWLYFASDILMVMETDCFREEQSWKRPPFIKTTTASSALDSESPSKRQWPKKCWEQRQSDCGP